MRRDLQRESAAMFSGCEAGQSRRSGELQRILRANHLRVRERGRRVSVHRHGRERLREERSRSAYRPQDLARAAAAVVGISSIARLVKLILISIFTNDL